MGLLILFRPDGFAMVMRPNKAENSCLAASARVIWLCAFAQTVGWCLGVSLAFMVVLSKWSFFCKLIVSKTLRF